MKNRSSMFTHKDYVSYVLDDYSVHITSEVRQALLARGYISSVYRRWDHEGHPGERHSRSSHAEERVKGTLSQVSSRTSSVQALN